MITNPKSPRSSGRKISYESKNKKESQTLKQTKSSKNLCKFNPFQIAPSPGFTKTKSSNNLQQFRTGWAYELNDFNQILEIKLNL